VCDSPLCTTGRVSPQDEATDDVPDEFLDPIMATIMNEPVILPGPGTGDVMDRCYIERMLLDSGLNPFSR